MIAALVFLAFTGEAAAGGRTLAVCEGDTCAGVGVLLSDDEAVYLTPPDEGCEKDGRCRRGENNSDYELALYGAGGQSIPVFKGMVRTPEGVMKAGEPTWAQVVSGGKVVRLVSTVPPNQPFWVVPEDGKSWWARAVLLNSALKPVATCRMREFPMTGNDAFIRYWIGGTCQML